MKCSILFSQNQIAARVAELGRDITAFYQGKYPTVITLLNGAIIFSADLVRAIDMPLKLDAFGVSSYDGDHSTGSAVIRSSLKLNPAGADILLVDDILDTGFTLHAMTEHFRNLGAASVHTCVLLDKILPEPGKKQFAADWAGFRIPNLFVVGYGLDYNEESRNLPYIGCMES